MPNYKALERRNSEIWPDLIAKLKLKVSLEEGRSLDIQMNSSTISVWCVSSIHVQICICLALQSIWHCLTSSAILPPTILPLTYIHPHKTPISLHSFCFYTGKKHRTLKNLAHSCKWKQKQNKPCTNLHKPEEEQFPWATVNQVTLMAINTQPE